MNKQRPDDWVNFIPVPMRKMGDVQQCNDNRANALISHSNKILLKVIAARMKEKFEEEISEEQAGVRPGKGTRDQILSFNMVIEKNREFNNVYICFIDSNKAFEMLSNVKLEMGFLAYVEMIENLYSEEKAAARTTQGLTGWFDVDQGVDRA